MSNWLAIPLGLEPTLAKVGGVAQQN